MNYLIPKTNNSFISRFFNDPTDLLFRDFFETESFFDSMFQRNKLSYPVDIKETKEGLEFDVAVVGLDKKDIKIEVKDNNTLSISYTKEDNKEDKKENEDYLYKGITSKAFNLAWRINSKFDLTKLNAKLDKGLLKISIPLAPESKPKEIEIIG